MPRRKQDPECAECGNDVWELPDDDGNRECAVCGAAHPHNSGLEDPDDEDPDDERETERLPIPRWDQQHRADYERDYWPDATEGEW